MARDLFDILSPSSRKLLVRGPQPAWVPPMLATLSEPRFSDAAWLYERKFDGVRSLVFRHGRGVRLFSRNRKPLNAAYPELVEAIERQGASDFIADGEVVAFEGDVSSFARLQGRLGIHDAVRSRATGIGVHLCLFDLVYAEGHDLTRLALRDRKALLHHLLTFDDPLRYSMHRIGDGESYFQEACRSGWEGLIAKRIDSTYQQVRSRDWRKFKCLNRQEFVIVGYTDPRRSRVGLGALLLGYHDQAGRMRYAGKVGTGFNDAALATIRRRLELMERADSPLGEPPPRMKGVHWVKPALIGEVAFSEWTRDGRLRHPTFVGFRTDKAPAEVMREGVAGHG